MQDKPELNETKQEARNRPRSPRAIGESEEWLFTTLESIGDAVIATDAVGLVVFMNQVAVTLTGWSKEHGQGKDCHEVFRIVNESTRLETESKEVTLEVRDDGPGFSQPFSPLTAGRFGLELVESVGRLDLRGATTYHNRPEGGACVRVIFPLPEMQGMWAS